MLDFLIIGQGIAGSVLALHLLQSGQRILVVNNTANNQSSQVSVGLYNPITGHRMVKTWEADTFFPYLKPFYKAAEQLLEASFLYEKPIFRPFLSEEERLAWRQKAAWPAYQPFVKQVVPPDYHQAYMKHAYGGLLLQQTGYVDVPLFLTATRTYLEGRKAYVESDWQHEQMQLGDTVRYQAWEAHKVIFCEGPQVLHNPFFKQLPWQLTKGEWITIDLPQPLDVIYNRKVLVRPFADQQAIVGATYDRHDRTLMPTERARKHLVKQLEEVYRLDYTIRDQKAGIRPTTLDGKPFVGLHHHYPQLGIFNGLGSKGVSTAPYLAKCFVDHLLHQQPLPQSVRLRRNKQPHYAV